MVTQVKRNILTQIEGLVISLTETEVQVCDYIVYLWNSLSENFLISRLYVFLHATVFMWKSQIPL